MTNNVFDLSAGIEIGVASTVAFTNSLFVNHLLTKKNFSKKDFFNMNLKIKKTIIKNKNTLNKLSNLNEAGFVLSNSINSFSSEASLKMSELTQNIFLSQDFNGLKHGFYSCINENETPIILDSNFSNNLLNQLISRKAITIGFNNKNLKYNLLISSKNSFEFEILKYVLIQITAFKIAIKKKLNPDKPRNLAKSITVES